MTMNATDNTYSHWHQTGETPRPHTAVSPLDSAIAFQRYRLTVISAWPEDEAKAQSLGVVRRALEKLESEQNTHPSASS